MSHSKSRPRRLRRSEKLRDLVAETSFSVERLIMPYFVEEGERVKAEIESMPGQYRFSIDMLLRELEELESFSVRHILLFGIPNKKDERASQAYDERGIVQRAVREIKKNFPNLTVITDVCLCEYMSHGHCGVTRGTEILNDETLPLLAQTAVSHAKAGADLVAPSDMMDGRVRAIRVALDESGFTQIPILSYAAKYASSFYSPFRDAAQSAPIFGDRKSYQMDIRNSDEALREVKLDLEEGADLIMVKPALPCLDVIRRVKDTFHVPVFAYQVSGEYAMLKAASEKGCINERDAVLEVMSSIFRSGAQAVITYYAKELASWLREDAGRFKLATKRVYPTSSSVSF